jgi:hypothetical protein
MKLLTVAAAVLLITGQAVAQEFRASISGQVADSTGAVIASNATTQTVSNNVGCCVVEFLLPGHYTLAVERPGFKKFVNTGITLEGSDHLALDISLELGALTENVTVTGQAVMPETETATLVYTVENRVLENIFGGMA